MLQPHTFEHLSRLGYGAAAWMIWGDAIHSFRLVDEAIGHARTRHVLKLYGITTLRLSSFVTD